MAAPLSPSLSKVSDSELSLLRRREMCNISMSDSSYRTTGVIYAANIGVSVLNMSLGTSANRKTFEDALLYAKSRGAILVGSAGNKGSTGPNYPASYPEVIGVAAVDDNHNRPGWSNFGSYINIAAPGVSVLSTANRFETTPYTVIERSSGGSPSLGGNLMIYTKYTGTEGIQGTLVQCGTGQQTCAANGSICLMNERYGTPLKKVP